MLAKNVVSWIPAQWSLIQLTWYGPRNILNKQGASTEAIQRIVDKTIFTEKTYNNPQQMIISTSTQISINNSLKETLKYIKSQANKKVVKTHKLGELWNNLDKDENNYKGELVNFVIDSSITNIFAA